MDNLVKEKSRVMKTLFVLGIIVCAYVLMLTISELKSYGFIGGGAPASNVISFDGKGEVTAAPDIATVSFTISDDEKELKTAQDKVTAKEGAVLQFLDGQKIEKKDIKTESYTSYPKYNYGTPCYGGYGVPCPVNNPTIIGYTVSENISVKVRDLTKSGSVVQGIGAVGVNDMNGPNFAIEKEDSLKAEARKMAIEDAKAKAEVLSKDLGVKLVRIVSFSENGNYPMYNTYGMDKAMSAGSVATPAPALPTGESKITSNVTITYEIR